MYSLFARSPSTPALLILQTNGRIVNDPVASSRLEQAIQPILERGIKVYAVGVGENINRGFLEQMVDITDNVFVRKNFGGLFRSVPQIVRRIVTGKLHKYILYSYFKCYRIFAYKENVKKTFKTCQCDGCFFKTVNFECEIGLMWNTFCFKKKNQNKIDNNICQSFYKNKQKGEKSNCWKVQRGQILKRYNPKAYFCC